MRTMADKIERERSYERSILGDPDLGDWGPGFFNMRSEGPDLDIDSSYVLKWPAGYWERYDALKAECLKTSGAYRIHMVIGPNGKYRVMAMLRDQREPYYSGIARDRHAAFEVFLAEVLAKKINDLSLTANDPKAKR